MRTRRAALRAGLAIFAGGMASPAFSSVPAVRTLRFDNLHTGEKLSIDYWTQGAYRPDALSAVNHVLRDYRNGQEHAIDTRLLDLLNLLHRTLESSAPFSVISGYRSPATNAAMHRHSAGVAAHSLHMQGMAIDIRLADRGLKDLHAAARSLRAGGVGFYPAEDFVHVDVGRVRHWGAAG
ncbi:MAG TPA: DUF882 domain-containing protein [Rhizomicrobium sp.]|jgi:uncharacterized protein YcbK (DUF882 family)|nr:DUF882 domain-containing protein [Rhizomicrobium sp.]